MAARQERWEREGGWCRGKAVGAYTKTSSAPMQRMRKIITSWRKSMLFWPKTTFQTVRARGMDMRMWNIAALASTKDPTLNMMSVNGRGGRRRGVQER